MYKLKILDHFQLYFIFDSKIEFRVKNILTPFENKINNKFTP